MKSFNDKLDSIDTHIKNSLGADLHSPDGMFIQQIVYGVQVETKVLNAFISNLYADNAASVARSDILFYTIFAYIAIFRLKELGFNKFKEIASSQDPTKIYNLTSYLFNKEVLWSSLRSDWMKVIDLTYVENTLIPGIEAFSLEIKKLNTELNASAASLAAAEAAKEEAKKNGSAGVGTVTKKSLTTPVSPRLNRPRPPKLPEPQRIPNVVIAEDVPEYINRTNLEEINNLKTTKKLQVREATISKYQDPTLAFNFNETKYGRKKDELLKELEANETREYAFDATFYNKPPDFNKVPAKVRLNASTILREDSLYRKQQAKDVAILKNYEEELRDPIEFYAWQQEMKEKDHLIKIESVAMRRAQGTHSYSPTYSPTYSLTYLLTHLLTHLLTDSPTYSLTYLLTHLLTHLSKTKC